MGEASNKPLISVVTPTWGRPRLLTGRCIPSVWAQTYRPLEHLIVVDGRDPDLRVRLAALGYTPHGVTGRRYIECGRNWGGVGHAARAAGALLAAGEWICYLDDDNEYQPTHVAAMVAEAQRSGAALVCTAWLTPTREASGWTPDGREAKWTPDGQVGGWTPPGTNHTDSSSFLHRAELLKLASWAPEAGYAADGALIDRWVAAGVAWAFLDEPTLTYHGPRGGMPETTDQPSRP